MDELGTWVSGTAMGDASAGADDDDDAKNGGGGGGSISPSGRLTVCA